MDDDPGSSSLWAITMITGVVDNAALDWTLGLKIIIIGICGYLSATMSGSEVAILSVNRIRLLELREEGRKTADILVRILEKPNQIISAILVGNTTVNVVLIIIWTNVLIQIIDAYNLSEKFLFNAVSGKAAVIIAGGIVLTTLIILFCEILPKRLFHRNPEYYALKNAYFLQKTIFFFKPLVWLTFNLSKGLLRLIGISLSTEATTITEEEIISLIETGEEQGFIQEEEKDMIHSIFEFGDLRVRDVMVPRVDMNALNKDTSIKDALENIVETGNSRVPVYGENRDDIIGLIYARDLLDRLGDENIDNEIVENMMRDVEFVPEEMQLSNLFNEMKTKKVHFAIVVDEYGGTAGVVTIEDVLEEIVGEIEDEFDIDKALFREEQGVWIVNGKLSLHDLEDLIDHELPDNGADTVGGLIFHTLGRIPDEGEIIDFGDLTFKVLTVINQRITEIEIRKLSIIEGSENEEIVEP